MKIINSLQNPEIKNVQKLQTKKGRDEQGKFIAQGLRICTTLIKSNAFLEKLYILEDMLYEATKIAPEQKINIVSQSIMNKIDTSVSPSGILGVFKIPKKPSLDLLNSGIVLAQISDPGNAGTLIRSAAAMGVKTVVLVEGVDPWSSKVIQASAGTISQINIFELTWQELIKSKKNLKLCALVISGGKSPNEINFKNCLLIVGSEAHGIPDKWISESEEKLTIPMIENAESLNAAVAGSIAMYLAFGKK